MGKKKITPKKGRRELPDALKRWNTARSDISKRNRQLGRKFNGIEVNELVKEFLAEFNGAAFTTEDISSYLKKDVKEFYSNPLDIPFKDIQGVLYFDIDDFLRNTMPKGVNVIINAGKYGVANVNTANYDYVSSGAQDIVEALRIPFENNSKGEFNGYIQNYKGRPNDGEPENYFIEMVLSVDGEEVVEILNFIPAKTTETRINIPALSERAKKERLDAKLERKKTRLKRVEIEKKKDDQIAELMKRVADLERKLKEKTKRNRGKK